MCFAEKIYVLEALNLCIQYVKPLENGNFSCEFVCKTLKITYLASLKTPRST